jgi:hypothetical protein
VAEQNRVSPLGDLRAVPLRGAWTGNRGRLHDGHEITRFHSTDSWVVCELQFRGRYTEQWQPNHYTFLYFLDEAVALAAGHRPCAECRRESYNAYRQAWAAERSTELPSAEQLNRQLHSERLYRGTHRRRLHELPWSELPDGVFVLHNEEPFIVIGDRIVGWTDRGYSGSQPRPRSGTATVITPPSSVHALRHGYPVQIDPAAPAIAAQAD